jgi:hypothetical protein
MAVAGAYSPLRRFVFDLNQCNLNHVCLLNIKKINTGTPWCSEAVGVMCGVMGKIVQDRSALSVLVRGNAHWRGLAAALVDDAVLAAQQTKQLWREDGLLMLVKYVIHNNDDNEDDDPSHFLCVCLSLSACVLVVRQVASPGGRDDGALWHLRKFVGLLHHFNSHVTGQSGLLTRHAHTQRTFSAVATQPLFDQALGVGEEDLAEQSIRFHTRLGSLPYSMFVLKPTRRPARKTHFPRTRVDSP